MKQLTGDDMTYESEQTLNLEIGQIWETYGNELLTVSGPHSRLSRTTEPDPNFWAFDVSTLSSDMLYSVTAKGRFWEGAEGFTEADAEDNLKRRITIDERPELFL